MADRHFVHLEFPEYERRYKVIADKNSDLKIFDTERKELLDITNDKVPLNLMKDMMNEHDFFGKRGV